MSNAKKKAAVVPTRVELHEPPIELAERPQPELIDILFLTYHLKQKGRYGSRGGAPTALKF